MPAILDLQSSCADGGVLIFNFSAQSQRLRASAVSIVSALTSRGDAETPRLREKTFDQDTTARIQPFGGMGKNELVRRT